MTPNQAEAKKFLQLLAGETLVTFQTFDDTKTKTKDLIQILHKATDNNISKLVALNEKGAGIFFMVNEGDGKGRKTENVVKVRAVFADFDGEPLPDGWGVTPHIIVESSPDRFHAYWLVNDCPLDKFTSVQKAISALFNSDPSVCDLPRVMRVPGLFHKKGEPFMTRILSITEAEPYPLQQIVDKLGIALESTTASTKGDKGKSSKDPLKGSKSGGRTHGITSIARTLANRKFPEDDAVLFCQTHDKLHNTPPLETDFPGKVEHTVRDVYERYVYSGIPEDIVELNDNHFMSYDGGKLFVFEEWHDTELDRDALMRITVNDFKNYYNNRMVVTGVDKKGNKIYEPLGTAWIRSTHRRQYHAIVMAPRVVVPGCYNLWRGFAVPPVKGTWTRMKNHILKIICGGDEKLFKYVMGWCARMVQLPGSPGEVALVLQGGRGTGKGIFANFLMRLLAHHACYIANSRHLTGNFNAHLESCVFLFVDEALWAGDKAGENVLKALVTEAITPIERKFVDSKQVRNMLHILMASNNDWVVPAGMDERRYCVIKVSDAEAGNHKYFEEVIAERNNGGLEAMLYDLLEWDLSDFNVREFPMTKGLIEQKLHTLDPVQLWWYQKLQEGEIASQHPWERLPVSLAHDDYCKTTSMVSGGVRRASETTFGMKFLQLLPEGWPVRKRLKPEYTFQTEQKRVMHYLLPPLDLCRKHFESLIKVEIEWDEPHLESAGIPPDFSSEL